MKKNLHVFDSPENLADSLSQQIQTSVNETSDKFYIAISGGSTPVILFKRLSSIPYKNDIQWNKLNFFWCDERCVPPDNGDSNFGETKKNLLDFISIPPDNIHRIFGESDPNLEAVRYASEIETLLPKGKNSLPVFDWVLLGIGEDGHTASLFPGKNLLFIYSNIAGVARHPLTNQNRISLTKDVLNNAKRVTFIVTGKSKAKIVSEIFNDLPISKSYPAAGILPVNGTIDWMIDKEAAFYL